MRRTTEWPRSKIRPMVRLRFLLACLVMLAIPMQGFAAASMLFCGMSSDHGAVAQSAAADVVVPPTHVHAVVLDVAASIAAPVSHDRAHASSMNTGHAEGHHASSDHACNICASCCHAAAMSATTHSTPTALPLQPGFKEPLVLVHSRPVLVPDKPPRA